MFLKRLYSKPEGLFEAVTFRSGINFIFGRKDVDGEPKESLNGIGKSLLLDLLDFCLLASFTRMHSPRLHKALNIISEYSIVLEFEIGGKSYVISRSFAEPTQNIEFGEAGDIRLYKLADLKPVLCDLIFRNGAFQGKYSSSWLRKLIPFYVKVEKPKKQRYVDPIRYIMESSPLELNVYHLMLMGIDNHLAFENYKVRDALKEKEPVIKQIKHLIQDTYGVRDLTEATSQMQRLASEITRLDEMIANFVLAGEYKVSEDEANTLTSKIKELWYLNYAERQRIEGYRRSFETESEVSPRRIATIYAQLNELVGDVVKKTLAEAVAFRKKLSESRRAFLEGEIHVAEKGIATREQEVADLEKRRARLFSFLSAQEAIKDLSEAYRALSEKRDVLSQIEGKLKLYNDLVKEKLELVGECARIDVAIASFLEQVRSQVRELWKAVDEVYQAIYANSGGTPVFDISFDSHVEERMKIDVSFPASDSKGKNQGRTLVYDLAVLFHAIRMNLPGPRFLVHDGIFDGVDKAHFVHLYDYLCSKAMTCKFQYIVTLNEEGTLTKKFGHAEHVTPEKIATEAIVVLTPKRKLFGKDF